MKAKKWLIGGLTAAMLASMTFGLAGCGDNKEPDTPPKESSQESDDVSREEPGQETPEVKMTDGIYMCEELAGSDGKLNFMRFHEDGIFYYAFMANAENPGGSTSAAGYWRVVEESYTYRFYVDDTATEYTVDSYIELTNFDGTPYENHMTSDPGSEKPEFDNKYPLKDDSLWGIWYSNIEYAHVLDNTVFTQEKESDKVVAEFVQEAGKADSVKLSHTGVFEDYISDLDKIYRGTWSYTAASRTYTLKTEDGDTAELVISAEGETADYTDFKGAKQELVDAAAKPAASEIEAVVEAQKDYFTLGFYNDGTYKVIAEVQGQTQEMKSGTWSMEIPYLTIDENDPIQMTGGDVTVTLPIATSGGDVDFDFVLNIEQLTTLSTTEIVAPESAAQALAEVQKDYFTLAFYEDGSYKVAAAMGEEIREMKAGSWSLAIPTLTVDETDYTMTAEGITVTISIPTSGGDQDFEFELTRDQLLQLNG